MINNQILASKLLETVAVRIQPDKPFAWASGLRSPGYSDHRALLSYPEIRTGLIDLIVKVAKDFELLVAGVVCQTILRSFGPERHYASHHFKIIYKTGFRSRKIIR